MRKEPLGLREDQLFSEGLVGEQLWGRRKDLGKRKNRGQDELSMGERVEDNEFNPNKFLLVRE